MACTHHDRIKEVTPSSPAGCTQCLAMGDEWVNLRICLECGQVGCCDSSKNQHATGHYKAEGHLIMQSFMPGEDFRWCYEDEEEIGTGPMFRK